MFEDTSGQTRVGVVPVEKSRPKSEVQFRHHFSRNQGFAGLGECLLRLQHLFPLPMGKCVEWLTGRLCGLVGRFHLWKGFARTQIQSLAQLHQGMHLRRDEHPVLAGRDVEHEQVVVGRGLGGETRSDTSIRRGSRASFFLHDATDRP